MSEQEKDDETTEVEELFYEGADLQGEGRYDEAMACFEKCLSIDPEYADALLGMAMVYVARDQFDEAIAVGLRLADLQPEDPLTYTNLSRFYQRAGRIAEAEEAAAKARMLDWKRQLAEDEKAG
jgi:tetratricopeptide (TPR) repeat protein